MWEVVATKEKVKYQIMVQLFSSDQPFTIQSLSKLTSASVRSIGYYLEEMKEDVMEVDGELIANIDGISLKLPTNIGLDYFQRLVYKNTMEFKFLEKLFFEDTMSNQAMQNALFISSSTLNRMIKRINPELIKRGLSINTNPLSISGKEHFIRAFYTLYFREAYSVFEWPFDKIPIDKVQTVVGSVKQRLLFKNTSLNYIEYLYLSAVSVTRAFNGHPGTNLHIHQLEDYNYDWIYETVDALDFPSEFKNAIISEIKPICSHLIGAFSDETIQHDCIDHHQVIRFILDSICNQFNLPENIRPSNSNTYIYRIDKDLSFYNIQPDNTVSHLHLLFEPRDVFMLDYYKNHYSKLYQSLYELLKEYYADGKDNKILMKDLMYIFLTNWSDLPEYLFQNLGTCKLLVHSHFNDIHAHNIANELRNKLSYNVEVNPLVERKISPEKLRYYDFDILITTTTLYLDIDEPIYYLNRVGGSMELSKLNKKIYSILLSNKNVLWMDDG